MLGESGAALLRNIVAAGLGAPNKGPGYAGALSKSG